MKTWLSILLVALLMVIGCRQDDADPTPTLPPINGDVEELPPAVTVIVTVNITNVIAPTDQPAPTATPTFTPTPTLTPTPTFTPTLTTTPMPGGESSSDSTVPPIIDTVVATVLPDLTTLIPPIPEIPDIPEIPPIPLPQP